MSTTDTRAAFEALITNGPLSYLTAQRMDNGEYISRRTRAAWTAYQAATEAAKATSVAAEIDLGEDLPPLPEPIEVGGEGWCWEDFQNEITFSADHMTAYGRACVEAARHDKDGNHADDLRCMLDELQAEFDKQQSAFLACSEKLAQVQRNQETDLSDIRILELAEEDFGEQDDRNVKNEALISFARKVQAARQPAPALPVKRIDLGHGAYLEFERKTSGNSGWLMRNEGGNLLRALNPVEVLLVDAALAATAAPVLSDEQIGKMARYLSDFSSAQCGVDKDDAWAIYGNDEIELVRAAFAATRSQP